MRSYPDLDLEARRHSLEDMPRQEKKALGNHIYLLNGKEGTGSVGMCLR